jgi:pyruvate/oxaloacetate carboxyltransferase
MGNNNFSINNLGALKKELEAVFAMRAKYRAMKEEEKEFIDTIAAQYDLPGAILRKVISGLERTEKQKVVDEKIQHLLLLLKGTP